MADAHDRKSFFKQLLRGAATTAQEVTHAFQDAQGFEEKTPDPYGLTFGHGYDERPVAAPPARRLATEAELRELAEAHDLGGRTGDLSERARTSIRLTRGEEGGRSRLGGAPELPEGFEWPAWRDEELDFVGQIDLAELAALSVGTGLPSKGLLLLFFALAARPTGMRPADKGALVLTVVDGELETAEDRRTLIEMPLAFSAELMLPSESAGFPASLVLAGHELDAWQRVRESLAVSQGVELEDRALEWHAIHRLGGYPDTTEDGMHVDAQLVFNGIDLNSGERYYEPHVADLEQDAEQWRLLLQLSSDDELALQLGYPLGRLFVWIREGDLGQGRLDDVWGFIR